MKKLLLMLALAVGTMTATTEKSQAQVSFSCNIGNQPMWGPTGYDYADYYYMPDIDAYYSINSNQFICQQNGQWGYYNSLPQQYGNYDLYNGYKVVINGRNPWMRHSYYRDRYYSYRGRRNQPFIRNSREYRYFANPGHPYHNQWRGDGYGRGGSRNGGYNNGYGGRNGRRDGYYSDNRDGFDRSNGRGGFDNRDGNRGGYDRNNDRRGGYDNNDRGGRNDGRDGNDRGGRGDNDNRGGWRGR